VICWSCNAAVDAAAPFCAACGKVQPPGSADHFTRLGLPTGFAVDRAELDKRYFALQRQLHPDRFATASARERAISQSQAVSLNDAYETLKDPLRRASYLLKLRGGGLASEELTVKDPKLLMEQMERREALAEAGGAAEIDDIMRAAADDAKASEARVAAAFAAGDLVKAASETTRLKYLVKLVDEARARKSKFAAVAGSA
jgi:molecular chaperone HscB